MSDPNPDNKPSEPAVPPGDRARHDASTKLSELLARPLGEPTPPADAVPDSHAPPLEDPAGPRRAERPAPLEPAKTSVEPRSPPAGPPTALDADAARALAKVRRLMLVSNLFMLVAITAVLAVIGYRVFRAEGSVAPAPAPVAAPAAAPAEIPVDMTLTLPRGARITQTAVAEDRIVITLEIDGAIEIRTFDLRTLQPAGRLSFTSVP